MTKEDFIKSGMDEISHLNDRRFLVALGGMAGIIYLCTRSTGTCALEMFGAACIGILTLGTVVTLTIRPERATATAPEPASAVSEVKQ